MISSVCSAAVRAFPRTTIVGSIEGGLVEFIGNGCAPLIRNRRNGIVACPEREGKLGPVKVYVHDGTAVCGHGNLVGAHIGPERSVHPAGAGIQIAFVSVGVRGFHAGQRIAIRETVVVISQTARVTGVGMDVGTGEGDLSRIPLIPTICVRTIPFAIQVEVIMCGTDKLARRICIDPITVCRDSLVWRSLFQCAVVGGLIATHSMGMCAIHCTSGLSVVMLRECTA